MNRDHVIETLRAHEADLHRAGVARLYLFGSVSRGEAGPDSNVDLYLRYRQPALQSD
ncbi:MAG TPA: nucleotidyltransferase domain-containing protein [Acetobacteraceae bacterium]|nr:nucleotidyltransferase domain-containing protein [Acetobacteraceae bacterium]